MRVNLATRMWSAGLALGLMMATTVVGVLAGRALDRELERGPTFVWVLGAAAMLWSWIVATRLVIRPLRS